MNATPQPRLDRTFDPELAHRQWRDLEPLVRSDPNQPALKHLLTLLGNSRFLVSFLIKNPDTLAPLLKGNALTRIKPLKVMKKELEGAVKDLTGDQAMKKPRRYKYLEMARIAVRETASLATCEEIGEELSRLASAEIAVACRCALKECGLKSSERKFSERLSVIGLGKLGGGDLNLSSDIDLIYLAEGKNWDGLHKAALKLTSLLDDRTEDGIVFRVDLNLRPQGKNGPLLNSLEGMELYYESQGDFWERMALIKALPLTEEKKLGGPFLALTLPFIYPRSIDAAITRDIKSLKDKINAQEARSGKNGFNVKLGRGGIREIEFFVSAFQLIYGGKIAALRERNTLRALQILEKQKLVPAEDVRNLSGAYVFLRRIENRLQMIDEQQTHVLSLQGPGLEGMARSLGFEGPEQFLEDFYKKTGWVSGCFERLAS